MSMWATIYGARTTAAPSSGTETRSTVETRQTVVELEERVDTLVLTCMAMWSLLRQSSDLSEDDLMDRVREIDLMDGVEDGKVTKHVAKCTQCGRVMSPRHTKCMYCGAERLDVTAFDNV